MNKKAIKYLHKQTDIWLDPNSKAYELYKEKKMGELEKHIDLCLLANEKWRR